MDAQMTTQLKLAQEAARSYRHFQQWFVWDEAGVTQAEERFKEASRGLFEAIQERYPRYRCRVGWWDLEGLEEMTLFLEGEGSEERCSECGGLALWVRKTQFARDHYFCDEHAEREENFGREDPSYFVWEMVRDRSEAEEEARFRRMADRRFIGLSPSGEVSQGDQIVCEGCGRLLPEGMGIGGVRDIETGRTYLVHEGCPNPPWKRALGG